MHYSCEQILYRYRRALKKEKEKQAEKELEELAVADPQALVDKMEEADKKRILVGTELVSCWCFAPSQPVQSP